MAPVVGSASAPACIALVPNLCLEKSVILLVLDYEFTKKVSINKGFYFNNIFVNFIGMKKGLFIVVIVAISFAIISCKKKTEPVTKPDLGEAYYPGTIGKYIIYDVDSIVFDEFTFDSTFYKYQIKEKIEEEYTDLQGRQALKLVRYIKKFSAAVSYTAMPWTIKDVWQVNIGTKNVEIVEENIRFVKLIFPVKENSKWNGNSTNTIGEWEYKYSYMDKQETIGGKSYEKVLEVVQKNFPTLISREYYMEKYAKDIGLVYREIIDLDLPSVTSTSIPPLNIPQKSGVIYKSTIVSHGFE